MFSALLLCTLLQTLRVQRVRQIAVYALGQRTSTAFRARVDLFSTDTDVSAEHVLRERWQTPPVLPYVAIALSGAPRAMRASEMYARAVRLVASSAATTARPLAQVVVLAHDIISSQPLCWYRFPQVCTQTLAPRSLVLATRYVPH